MATTDSCPLCGSLEHFEFHADRRRSYRRCARCALVFVAPEQRLSREQERAEYDLHRNDLNDPGYRRFLSRLSVPLLAHLPQGSRGLDFGCGPAPLLAQMLTESGHAMALHDSMYCPAPEHFETRFDFVTATEVVEHLHQPGAELQRLWDCLLPGGWLAVMTKLVRDAEAFATWHYIRDPTHVCFFSRRTWRWWAERQHSRARFEAADVVLFQKPDSGNTRSA